VVAAPRAAGNLATGALVRHLEVEGSRLVSTLAVFDWRKNGSLKCERKLRLLVDNLRQRGADNLTALLAGAAPAFELEMSVYGRARFSSGATK
jgi:hypothetical protein